MRWRKCKRCGEAFQAQKEQYLCPTCLVVARRESVMRVRRCIVCGTEFVGNPSAKYCAICRGVVERERAAKYRKNGAARHRGDTDTCVRCGKEYTVESGSQKFCKECAEEAYKERNRPRKREYNAANRDAIESQKKERRANSKICVICGKTFTPETPEVTCSPECADIRRKQYWAKADEKRRGAPPRPPAEKQSGIPYITWHCKREKWQVKYRDQYIGLYSNLEDAKKTLSEAVKKDGK